MSEAIKLAITVGATYWPKKLNHCCFGGGLVAIALRIVNERHSDAPAREAYQLFGAFAGVRLVPCLSLGTRSRKGTRTRRRSDSMRVQSDRLHVIAGDIFDAVFHSEVFAGSQTLFSVGASCNASLSR